MLRKFVPFVFAVVAVFVNAPLGSAGNLYDVSDSATEIPAIMPGTPSFIYSVLGGQSVIEFEAEPNRDIAANADITIGVSNTGVGEGFALKIGTITLGGHTVTFSSAENGSNKNVTLDDMGGVNLNNGGGTAIFGQDNGSGTITVNSSVLAANGFDDANLTFNSNSNVSFTNVTGDMIGGNGTTNDVTITLNGGKLGFLMGSGNDLTLGRGAINVTKSSYLGVATTLIIDGAQDANSKLTISDNAQLHLLKNKDNPSVLGDLVIGGGTYGGTLSLLGPNARLYVANLEFSDNATLDQGSSGQIIANTLTVSSDFNDAVNTATIVSGRTIVEVGTTYTVKGGTADATRNKYAGGMTILQNGILQGDNSATRIEFGDSLTSTSELLINGGHIVAGSGVFAIDYATVNIVSGDTAPTASPATLDAKEAALDLSKSHIVVNSNSTSTVTIDVTKGIDAYSYTQRSGTVWLSSPTNGGKLTVTQPAVIGSSTASGQVTLDVSGDAAHFAGGLTLDPYGAITADRASGSVSVGTSGNASSAVITANGNNLLKAAAGNLLQFNDASQEGGRMIWNNKGNRVIGEVSMKDFNATIAAGSQVDIATVTTGVQNGNTPVYNTDAVKGYEVGSMTVYGKLGLGIRNYPDLADTAGGMATGVLTAHGDVWVKSGGTIIASYGTEANRSYIVNGAGAGNVLKVDKGGTLWADTSTIYVKDFDSVTINGTFIAGLLDASTDPTTAARLMANSDITIGSTGLITMTADLASTVTSGANENAATKLIEVEAGKTITNFANMTSKSMLGIFGFALNQGATVLYVESAKGQVSLDGSEADRLQAWENLKEIWGEKQINYDLSNIIYDVVKGDIVAEPADSIAGNKNLALLGAIASPEGKVVGVDTLEYLNGAHLYGVTDVAMQTNRSFMSDILNRAKVVGCQFDQGLCATGAYASSAMHDTLLNRFWFGGSGFVQDADSRDGFSGYKYKSYGFSGGYDRVLTPGVAGGFAFAYNKGDYEDKGAAAHDSDIENFSAGLYSTYTNPCGWFATGHAAFTYAENDIRELRNDPDAERYSWARSKFHTNVWSIGALAGRDFRIPGCGVTISPSVGLNYIIAKNSNHTSYLDGVGTQKVSGAKNSVLYAPVDLSVQYDWLLSPCSKLRVEGNAGYAYNIRGSGMTGSITYVDLDPLSSIGIHGRDNAKHSYKFGGVVRYQYKTFDVGLQYAYAGQEGYSSHRVTATAGISF